MMIGQSNASLYSNKLIGLLVLTRYQSTIILLDMSRSLPISDNASIGSSNDNDDAGDSSHNGNENMNPRLDPSYSNSKCSI